MCGFEYTNKLHRMFTDMSLSDDLNASFGEFLKEKTPLGLSFTVQILQVRKKRRLGTLFYFFSSLVLGLSARRLGPRLPYRKNY